MKGSLINVLDVEDLITKMGICEWEGFFVEDEKEGIFAWRDLNFQLSREGFRRVMEAYEQFYRCRYRC